LGYKQALWQVHLEVELEVAKLTGMGVASHGARQAWRKRLVARRMAEEGSKGMVVISNVTYLYFFLTCLSMAHQRYWMEVFFFFLT
jgi:hypothetical protein